MTSDRCRALVAAGTLLLALSTGCGGDDQSDGDASPAPVETASDSTTDADAVGSRFDCPLSAEQVGDILGTSVEKDDATCTYAPSSGELPVTGFLAQLPELCDDGFPQQTGYTEPVDGLGVDAYLMAGGAATAEIWVCAPAAFTVYVDTGDSDPAAGAAFAEELASAALAAS